MAKRRQGLSALAEGLNLTVPIARGLADGTRRPANADEQTAMPALRHAYAGVIENGTSLPAAYDLGLRLLAKDTQSPVRRAVNTSRFTWDDNPPVVVMASGKTNFEIETGTVDGQGLHDYLYSLINFPTVPGALIVDRAATLPKMKEAIHSLSFVEPRVTALIKFYELGLAHSGSGVAMSATSELSSLYATAYPVRETEIDFWSDYLGIEAEGFEAFEAIAQHLMRGTINAEKMSESWRLDYLRLRRSADDGQISKFLTQREMATTLTSMSANSDWLLGWKITNDQVYAQSERWTGRVVHSNRWVSSTPSSWTFAVGDVPVRHRPGSSAVLVLAREATEDEEAEGLVWDKTIKVDVDSVGYDQKEGMLITLTCDGKTRSARSLDRAVDQGLSVFIRPDTPSTSLSALAGSEASKRRYAADQRSWFANPERVPDRREVPWEVLVAAAV